MHQFSLHPDPALYLLAFAGLIFCCGVYSTLLRLVAPQVPYSALILSIVSILFALAFNADYYNFSPSVFALSLALVGIITTFLIWWKVHRSLEQRSLFNTWRQVNSLKEFVFCYLLWFVGLLIILVPLAFGYAPDSLITGHFICNDSALHSILAEGIWYSIERNLDPIYYLGCPRGIHSFTYYLNKLTVHKPTSRVILAAAIASFSLVTLWADTFVRRFSFSGFYKLLLPFLSITAFLLSTTTYLIFLGQISALAMTLMSITVLFYFQSFGSPAVALALFSSLSLGAITTYGLFSGSIIGFGVGLNFLYLFFKRPSLSYFLSLLKAGFATVFSPSGIFCTLILLGLVWPSIQFSLYILSVQGSGSTASDLASAVGNLPGGYLSPLHLSGLWPSGVGYRESLVGPHSALANILMFIIAVQVWLIASARFTAPPLLILFTFVTPWLASQIFINSPYVHFKYLTYLVPPFILISGIAGATVVERISVHSSKLGRCLMQGSFGVTLLAYLAYAIWTPLYAASITPTVLEGHLATFEAVAEEISNKRALILSREDWLQYYIQPDDIVPLTLYIPQNFHGQTIDLVVIDKAYKADALEFLKPYPRLLELVSRPECMKNVSERFESYRRGCLSERK